MTRLTSTLAALAILGGTAGADSTDDSAARTTLAVESSRRGVAQDYLVVPRGGELGAQLRFVTSQPHLGGEPLRFSDLALFGISGRWIVLPERLELAAQADFVPKQPSYTDEKPWQSVSLGVRTPIGTRAAIALTGGGGHLLAHEGMWTRTALTVQWRKAVSPVLTFDLSAGGDAVTLGATDSLAQAMLTEAVVTTSALLRDPYGKVGAWAGVSYALPLTARGVDPTTEMEIDPQPRLDFRVGAVLSLVREWDLFAELAIIDRGDLANPATRLPILDGGFDQRQFVFGVVRHIEVSEKRRSNRDPLLIGGG